MFKKGDYVRIRSWKDMVEEFGFNKFGTIDSMEPAFCDEMSIYCGEIRLVSEVDEEDNSYLLEGIDFWFPAASLKAAEKQRKLKVGDVVRVRAWDSMEEEFGLDADGDIDTSPCFVEKMRPYCENVFAISGEFDGCFYLRGADDFVFGASQLTLVDSQEIKVKVGDTVRVRSWKSMEEEFGLDNDGDIDTPTYPFFQDKEHLCGKNLKVAEVDNSDGTFKDMNDHDWFPLECVAEVITENNGLADNQEHYKASAMQPIEVMQTFLSHEAFKGFLLGNYIKYNMRAQHKGQAEADKGKAMQYLYWYDLVKNNADYIISPENDVPDADWIGKEAL